MKTNDKKKTKIADAVLSGSLLFMIISIIVCVTSSMMLYDAYKAIGHRETIEAQVTRCYETKDDETFVTEYKIYVSYDYDGEHYTDVFYGTQSKPAQLHGKVNVEINSGNPGELLELNSTSDIIGSAVAGFVGGAVFVGALHHWVKSIIEKRREVLNKTDVAEAPSGYDESGKTDSSKKAMIIVVAICLLGSVALWKITGFILLLFFTVPLIVQNLLRLRVRKSDV